MATVLVYCGAAILSILAFIGLSFFIYSILEDEKRASFYGGLQFLGLLTIFGIYLTIAGSGYFYTDRGYNLLLVGIIAAIALIGFFVRKTEPNKRALEGAKGYIVGDYKRFDERKAVFSRVRYEPGTTEYEQFYKENPETEEIDRKRREKGGTLGTYGSIDAPNEKPNVAAMVGLRYFGALMAKPEFVRPEQARFFKGHKEKMSPEEASERIKGYTKHLGACLVGITKLDPKWVYSHVGTIYKDNWDYGEMDWSKWGKEINPDHKYVIVFAEEMDRELINSSPHSPCFVESMKNYAQGAFITTQLAQYLANLGYSAQANHIQHYELILPPIAQEAGLGEIGRMGYLLTKKYGPRVRLSAVSTDMVLAVDKPVDIGVEDFCRICKKCADTCPSRSIPAETEMTTDNGVLRWKTDPDSCFSYWGKVGTDCCVCMRVCPWSHARTWPHELIVWVIARNKWARRLFNFMDDIFYGSHPRPKDPPKWASFAKRN